MWKTARRWLELVTKPAGPSGVYLGCGPPPGDGVVVGLPFGDRPLDGSRADLQLTGPIGPEGVRAVVRFCARRSLPVAAWRISGLWHTPARADELARWLRLLVDDAGTSQVWVDTAGMPPKFRRRLEAHLRRLGCLEDSGCSAGA